MLKQFKKVQNIPVSESQLEGYNKATNLCVIVFLLLITQKFVIMNILMKDTKKRP